MRRNFMGKVAGYVVASMVACGVAGWASDGRAMTPGSMIGVCYSNGKCTSIEGASLAAIVDKVKSTGLLGEVRQVDLTMFRAPAATADVVRAFAQLSRLVLDWRDEPPELGGLVGHGPLRELSVRHAPQSALATIAKLTQLETLELQGGSFTKIDALGSLTRLKRLTLNDAAVTSLKGIEKAPLIELELARTKVAELAPLRGMTSLHKLRINESRIRDLSPLAGLTALEELYAYETKIVSLHPLSELKGLTVLDVNQTGVGELAPLAKLPRLRDLNLAQTRVKSLVPLHESASLAFLYLTKGAVPAAEIAAFEKSLPSCRINY